MYNEYDSTQPFIDYSGGFPEYHQYYSNERRQVPRSYEDQFQSQQRGLPTRLGCDCNDCPSEEWPQKYKLKIPSKEMFSGGSGASGVSGSISNNLGEDTLMLIILAIVIAILIVSFKTLQTVNELKKTLKSIDRKINA